MGTVLLSIVALALILGGAALLLVSSIGLLRLPDAYTRCHAAGKAATVGICAVLLGSAMLLGEIGAVTRAALAAAFLLYTVPVATQLLARSALRGGVEPASGTAWHVDDGGRDPADPVPPGGADAGVSTPSAPPT